MANFSSSTLIKINYSSSSSSSSRTGTEIKNAGIYWNYFSSSTDNWNNTSIYVDNNKSVHRYPSMEDKTKYVVISWFLKCTQH